VLTNTSEMGDKYNDRNRSATLTPSGNARVNTVKKAGTLTRQGLGDMPNMKITDSIISAWMLLSGKNKQAVEKLYDAKVKDLQFYGCIVFSIQFSTKGEKGSKSPAILALNSQHITIYSIESVANPSSDQKFLRQIILSQIASYVPKGNLLTLTHGNLVQPSIDLIYSDQAADIARTIKSFEQAAAAAVLKQKGKVRNFL